DASLSEIKRAFRNLSIILHPDKSDAEDANIQFRNMVAVYEVLKDTAKREKYDNVLKNGLPNWKSAVYYYRKARKMGLMEGTLLLFIIITIGQYLVSWAVYFEKKYTMAQFFESKAKKVKKANVDFDSILSEIPKPSIKNTLPFQIPIGLYHMVIGTPSAIKGSVNLISEEVKKELERKRKEKEEEELMKKLEEERQQQKEERKEGLRRRKEQRSKLMERTDEELAAYSATIIKHKGNEEIKVKVPISGGLWTDDDLVELTRLTKKYPGGTVDRWEIIAETMGRNVSEVTFMAYKLKDNVYQSPGDTEKLVENINKEITKKIKTRSTDVSSSAEKGWTQQQQKALENAIQKYPKRGNEDRWSKIAAAVPGKTREECQLRYKYLVELVKKQKEENDSKQQEPEKEQEEEVETKVEEEIVEDQEEVEVPQQKAESLKQYTNVIDMWEFFEIIHKKTGRPFVEIDEVYKLQHFDAMFESGVFIDKFEETVCSRNDYDNNHYFEYYNITENRITCLNFQGSASLLQNVLETYEDKKLLKHKKQRIVLFAHAETALHDSFGDKEYWEARRSMRFNKYLEAVATAYRMDFLGSTNENGKVQRPDSWTDEKSYRGAVGGEYVCVHMRRADFLYGREPQIPTLRSIANQIKRKLAELQIHKVYLSSDCSGSEFHDLKSLLRSVSLYRFKPPWEYHVHLGDGGLAVIDQIICSHASWFIGTFESTFTYRIYEEREILGFPQETTFNTLCKRDDLIDCNNNSVWPIRH
ncbi:CLUMA_CG004881, isoform A, partial [Clunio marinus]